jgi:pimeloyl-ACP methyl ester carboxylesterase
MWHEVTGSGPPVLLLHAGIADARMWERECSAWAADFRVVRCDLAGFGQTPVPPDAVMRPAADTAALLDELGLTEAAVVGASFGGSVALELAVGRPDLVRRLVLAASALPGHDWSAAVRAFGAAEDAALGRGDLDAAVQANLETWVAGPSRSLDDVDPRVVALVAAMQRRAFELQLPVYEQLEEAPLAEGFAQRLGEIAVPVLALSGELDQPDGAVIARHVVTAIPDARHVPIAGAAHLPNLEQPARFDEAVLPFLAA